MQGFCTDSWLFPLFFFPLFEHWEDMDVFINVIYCGYVQKYAFYKQYAYKLLYKKSTC